MTKFILFGSLLFVLPNFAQTNEIYGISRNNNSNVTYLAKVNTTNGLIRDVSNTSHSDYIANFSFTVDPIAGIYYYSDLNNFIGVDMNTGELVQDNPITTTELPIFQNSSGVKATVCTKLLDCGWAWIFSSKNALYCAID